MILRLVLRLEGLPLSDLMVKQHECKDSQKLDDLVVAERVPSLQLTWHLWVVPGRSNSSWRDPLSGAMFVGERVFEKGTLGHSCE